MTPPERRYRRTLRLLPAGYRKMWEEDMVDSYLESASHHGGDASSARSWAEHLSVFGLAVRLRLSGAHASPRGLAWRAAVHGFALVALLYLALSGIMTVTTIVLDSLPAFPASFDHPTPTVSVLYWSSAIPALLWVTAFVTVVLGRATATRLLVLLAFFAQVGLMIANILLVARPHLQSVASAPGVSLMWRKVVESSVASGAWIAIVTVATLIAAEASKPRRNRWLWLGGAAVLAFVLVAAEIAESAAYPVQPATYVNLGVAVHLGLLAAMVAALALRRNPRWLLALALFVALFAGGELLDYVRYILDGRSVGQVYFSPPSYTQRFDVGLMALAVVCAFVGVIGLRRFPRAQPSATQA